MPHATRNGPRAATKRTGRSKLGLAVVTIASMVLLALLPASPAQAATSNNGVCETGEFCYYYNSNNAGSLRDFTSSSLATYFSSTGSCYKFKSAGSGQGQCIKNNSASVWNRKSSTVTVYYNSNYGGASQSFASGVKRNFNTTLKNNNASHRSGLFDDPTVDVSGVDDRRCVFGTPSYTSFSVECPSGPHSFRAIAKCDVRFRLDYWTYGEVRSSGQSIAECGGGHRAYDYRYDIWGN